MKTDSIVTIPPYAPYIKEIARHPIVSGVRLNTVMPLKGTIEDNLKRLKDEARGKDLWVDLKCRQLRISGYWVPPYTIIELSHKIKLNTPATAYFGNGKEYATILQVDGNKLIMQEGPRRVVGPGEAVNIIDDSLEIEGYFTDNDKRYIEAAEKVGLHNYMLSFVESYDDVKALKRMTNNANIIAKIESKKGVDYVSESMITDFRLMAARGDLYVELERPHHVITALETILKQDKKAVVASRLFTSLVNSLEPSCEDIGDVDNLLRMGYRTFMFGDDICFRRESILSGLNLLEAMGARYE